MQASEDLGGPNLCPAGLHGFLPETQIDYACKASGRGLGQVSAAAGYVAFCGAAPDNVLDGPEPRGPQRTN